MRRQDQTLSPIDRSAVPDSQIRRRQGSGDFANVANLTSGATDQKTTARAASHAIADGHAAVVVTSILCSVLNC